MHTKTETQSFIYFELATNKCSIAKIFEPIAKSKLIQLIVSAASVGAAGENFLTLFNFHKKIFILTDGVGRGHKVDTSPCVASIAS